MNLFKWINEVFMGKRDWNSFTDEDRKTFSPFMINRYLSMKEDYLPLVNHFQKLTIGTMPHSAVYRFYCNLLPKRKEYLKYISGNKRKVNKDLIGYLVDYFEISTNQALDYYDLLSKDDLKSILKEYGKSKKEMKSMGVK
tara:strand:+ start:94 stop:513 length:420 start_codon:yes stop_codon:yes gene_type:complete